jgi:hypothetical protein
MTPTELSRISYSALIRFHMTFAALVAVVCLVVVACGGDMKAAKCRDHAPSPLDGTCDPRATLEPDEGVLLCRCPDTKENVITNEIKESKSSHENESESVKISNKNEKTEYKVE